MHIPSGMSTAGCGGNRLRDGRLAFFDEMYHVQACHVKVFVSFSGVYNPMETNGGVGWESQ